MLLVDGDAIIIEKPKSLFVPFEDVISSAVAVGVLKSNQVDKTCQPIDQTITKSPFKLLAKPYKKNEDLSFWDFLQTYFLPDVRDLQPEVYSINAVGCSDVSGHKGLVHCFPTFEWKGKVEAGMEHKYNEVGLLEDRKFTIGGEIEYIRNGNSTKFGGKSTSSSNKEVSFPKLESMLTSIVSSLDDIKNKNQELALNKAGKTRGMIISGVSGK